MKNRLLPILILAIAPVVPVWARRDVTMFTSNGSNSDLSRLVPIPEPSVVALLILAFLIVLWRVRSRQTQLSESTWESRWAERAQLEPVDRVPRGQ